VPYAAKPCHSLQFLQPLAGDHDGQLHQRSQDSKWRVIQRIKSGMDGYNNHWVATPTVK